MTADLVRLGGAGPIFEPQQDVIAELKDLLERAERAEIKGLGFFFVDAGDRVSTGWAAGCAGRNDMVTAAVLLEARVVAARRADEGKSHEHRDH